MQRSTYIKELDIPIDRVWYFVSNMDKWAPLVPGYAGHEMVNERQSTWNLQGNLGMMHKNICLKIDVIEWQKPTKIVFLLTGLNENIAGEGFFKAIPISDQRTKIIGHLDMKAKGMMGPMINSVLKSILPKTTKRLTEKVASKIAELETVAQ